MNLLGLLRRGRSTGTDCPDRFVGDYGRRERRDPGSRDDCIKLPQHDLPRRIPLALGQRFTDAEDRDHPVPAHGFELARDQRVALAVDCAPFRMPDDP